MREDDPGVSRCLRGSDPPGGAGSRAFGCSLSGRRDKKRLQSLLALLAIARREAFLAPGVDDGRGCPPQICGVGRRPNGRHAPRQAGKRCNTLLEAGGECEAHRGTWTVTGTLSTLQRDPAVLGLGKVTLALLSALADQTP